MEHAVALASLPVATLLTGPDRRVRAANGRAETLFRTGPGELAGLPLAALFPHEQALDQRLAVAACGESVRIDAERRDGTPFSAELAGGVAGDGELLWTVREPAAADRRALIAELERRLAHAARHGEEGAVLLVGLDGLGAIESAGGRAAAQRALDEIAGALAQRVRATDLLGRIGGDQLAVIVSHVGADGAAVLARDLLAAVREHADAAISAGCGIALYGPDRPGEPDHLLAAAGAAMHAAKSAGAGRARVAA